MKSVYWFYIFKPHFFRTLIPWPTGGCMPPLNGTSSPVSPVLEWHCWRNAVQLKNKSIAGCTNIPGKERKADMSYSCRLRLFHPVSAFPKKRRSELRQAKASMSIHPFSIMVRSQPCVWAKVGQRPGKVTAVSLGHTETKYHRPRSRSHLLPIWSCQ